MATHGGGRTRTDAVLRARTLLVLIGVLLALALLAIVVSRFEDASPGTAGPAAPGDVAPKVLPETSTPPAAIPEANVDCGYGTFGPGRWPSACWRPYAATSPFNIPVPSAPRVLPGSRAMVDKVLAMGPIADLVVAADTDSDYYHPVYWSQPTDPVYTVHCTRTWGTCEIEGHQVRIPAAARPAAGGDGHLAVVDQVSGWEYDLWQVKDKRPQGGVLDISWGGRTEIKGDGLGSDATAAHFGLLAGIIRAEEMRAGRIDHALFMFVGCTAETFVHPAKGKAAVCPNQTNAPPDGQHFWLEMSEAEIDALDVPAWKKTILRALARYGAFVGDTGGNEAFGFAFESGSSYTSFGLTDPLAEFAARQRSGVTHRRGRYYFDLGSGVDWRHRLRALDPCVLSAACGPG